MLETIIADRQKSQIFGLNLLQDMKYNPAEITGGYNPKEQRWIMQEQVHDGSLSDGSKHQSEKTWTSTKCGNARDSVAD